MSRTTEGTAIFHDHPNRQGLAILQGKAVVILFFGYFFKDPEDRGSNLWLNTLQSRAFLTELVLLWQKNGLEKYLR